MRTMRPGLSLWSCGSGARRFTQRGPSGLRERSDRPLPTDRVGNRKRPVAEESGRCRSLRERLRFGRPARRFDLRRTEAARAQDRFAARKGRQDASALSVCAQGGHEIRPRANAPRARRTVCREFHNGAPETMKMRTGRWRCRESPFSPAVRPWEALTTFRGGIGGTDILSPNYVHLFGIVTHRCT